MIWFSLFSDSSNCVAVFIQCKAKECFEKCPPSTNVCDVGHCCVCTWLFVFGRGPAYEYLPSQPHKPNTFNCCQKCGVKKCPKGGEIDTFTPTRTPVDLFTDLPPWWIDRYNWYLLQISSKSWHTDRADRVTCLVESRSRWQQQLWIIIVEQPTHSFSRNQTHLKLSLKHGQSAGFWPGLCKIHKFIVHFIQGFF